MDEGIITGLEVREWTRDRIGSSAEVAFKWIATQVEHQHNNSGANFDNSHATLVSYSLVVVNLNKDRQYFEEDDAAVTTAGGFYFRNQWGGGIRLLLLLLLLTGVSTSRKYTGLYFRRFVSREDLWAFFSFWGGETLQQQQGSAPLTSKPRHRPLPGAKRKNF